MVDVHVYVEGGPAEGKALRSQCQRGFSELLSSCSTRRPRIIACGPRSEALARFVEALRINRTKVNLLLVDAEAPIVDLDDPWTHLAERDGWSRPSGASDDDVHLMVQTMEAWILADREALARFFGAGFRDAAIPAWPTLERVPKAQLYRALLTATKGCRRAYTKGGVSFEVLGNIDGLKVRASCPSFARFAAVLARHLDGPPAAP